MTQRYDLVIAGGGPIGRGRRVAGRADRRQGSGAGQGRVPPRQAVRRRPDRPRGQLPAEDGPGRRGRHVPPGQPRDGVQPDAVGAVVPEAPRDARPRPHRQPRPHLDTRAAQARRVRGRRGPAGRARSTGPEFDASGRVVGVVLKGGEKVYGDAVIAADGAYSPIKRALKIDSEYNGYSAIAIRSEMHANRPDSDSLDIYLKLEFQGDQLPGYGWVFPMGDGRLQHRPRLRQQLQELAVDQRHPVPRRVPAARCPASGSCRRSRS